MSAIARLALRALDWIVDAPRRETAAGLLPAMFEVTS